MLTAEDLHAIRAIVADVVRVALHAAPAKARAPAPDHPHLAPVTAFLRSLPVDGRRYTSRELHAAFLASPHAAPLSVQRLCALACQRRALVDTRRDGARGSSYWRVAPAAAPAFPR